MAGPSRSGLVFKVLRGNDAVAGVTWSSDGAFADRADGASNGTYAISRVSTM
jgi:hypothetical protein